MTERDIENFPTNLGYTPEEADDFLDRVDNVNK
jgi:hypothetical protein